MTTAPAGQHAALLRSPRVWRRRLWVLRTLRGAARVWALRRYLESPAQRADRLAGAHLGAEGRLVFVCHGNIMRSAFATQVARSCAPQLVSRIVGAGTHAVAGRRAQDAAIEVGRELAWPLDAHTATPLAKLGLTAHDVIVCMDALNEANVAAAHPALSGRVFRVGDIETGSASIAHADREIRDPYGEGLPVTRDAFERLARLTRQWVNHTLRH